MRAGGDQSRFGTAGCIVLPAALFIALMIATAGVALWPQLAAPGAAIVCGGGEVVYESYGASYRPGEYTVTRQLYCQSGTGKEAARDEITFPAMGVSFLIYAVVSFLLLQFVVRPLLARRLRRKLEALGMTPAPPPAWPGVRTPPAGLRDTLQRLQDAMQRREADLRAGGTAGMAAPEHGDVAARLTELKALRDQGLITAGDYEAKKAEILSRL